MLRLLGLKNPGYRTSIDSSKLRISRRFQEYIAAANNVKITIIIKKTYFFLGASALCTLILSDLV